MTGEQDGPDGSSFVAKKSDGDSSEETAQFTPDFGEAGDKLAKVTEASQYRLSVHSNISESWQEYLAWAAVWDKEGPRPEISTCFMATGELHNKIGVVQAAFKGIENTDQQRAWVELATQLSEADATLAQINDVVTGYYRAKKGKNAAEFFGSLPSPEKMGIVLDAMKSEKANLSLPELGESIVVLSMDEAEQMKREGQQLLLLGKVDESGEGGGVRFLKLPDQKKPGEMVLDDYMTIQSLQAWAKGLENGPDGLPSAKPTDQWTSHDRAVQRTLDTIAQSKTYFEQSYGVDVAHHTNPSIEELNAFHLSLQELHEQVQSGNLPEEISMVHVETPEATVDSFVDILDSTNPPTAVMPVPAFDETAVMSPEIYEELRREALIRPRPLANLLGTLAAKGLGVFNAARNAFNEERMQAAEPSSEEIDQSIDGHTEVVAQLEEELEMARNRLGEDLPEEKRAAIEAILPEIERDLEAAKQTLAGLRSMRGDDIPLAA